MRIGLTIARKHGDTAFTLVACGKDIRAQSEALKKLATEKTHPEYAEVQLWISDRGEKRKVKFQPAPAENPSSDQSDPPDPSEKPKTILQRVQEKIAPARPRNQGKFAPMAKPLASGQPAPTSPELAPAPNEPPAPATEPAPPEPAPEPPSTPAS